MNREQFITEHLVTCQAARARKYDPKKHQWALHSLEYSRRKCAKALWRKVSKPKHAGAT